tara:strand:- start:4038 stop:4292 length:255 start_codon:yes stop_codon:yes gene_type:complete
MADKRFNNATKVSIEGKKFNSIVDACKFYKISRTTVQSRMANHGMSVTQALLSKIVKKDYSKRYKPSCTGTDYYLYSFKVGEIS